MTASPDATPDATTGVLLSLTQGGEEYKLRYEETLTQKLELEKKVEEYQRAYVVLLEAFRKLEAGIHGQSREKHINPESSQQVLQFVLDALAPKKQPEAEKSEVQVPAHARVKPTGRKPLSEDLPRIDVEVLPLEVQKEGLDAFEKMGETVSETVEKRPSSLVVVRTVRPKFVRKQADTSSAPVVQAPPPELPLPKALAGPGLLADSIVKRFQEHSPLHRMERIYGREGLTLARSTLCGWHQEVSSLVQPLWKAMWEDALQNSPYLCMDATGVLVQQQEKCRTGHFFVMVAPERCVVFGYSPKHDKNAVDTLLADYKGYLVADAHSVYNHLYENGVVEVACWAHVRRYFWKALSTDKARGNHALNAIQKLSLFEREWATAPPEERRRLRQEYSIPIAREFLTWCEVERMKALEETPIWKGLNYACNQKEALLRFAEDGRLPLTNNISERHLRREALGRKNWLFVATDEGGTVNATLVTLLASCEMHGIEPFAWLRDVLCLLPEWNVQNVLELSPMKWRETSQREDVQKKLEANAWRQVSTGKLKPRGEA